MKATELPVETLQLHISGNRFNCENEAFLTIEVSLSNLGMCYVYSIRAEFHIEEINGNSIEYICNIPYEIVTNGEKPSLFDLQGMANTGVLKMQQRLYALLREHTNYKATELLVPDQPLLERLIRQELDRN